MPGALAGLNGKRMKTKITKGKKISDRMRANYDFSKGVRGKHAAQYAAGTNVVVIEPDVAAEFPTAKDVNDTLRTVAKLLQRRRNPIKRKTA